MDSPRGPTRWLRHLGLARKPRPDQSVAWEIEHHLSELVDRLVAEGSNPGDAQSEAERRFGDRKRYGPSMRRIEKRRLAMERRVWWRDVVRQSLTSVVRTARRYPGYTAGVIVTLGLGLGANVAMFGVVDRLLLRSPSGIVEAERVHLVGLSRVFRGVSGLQYSLTFPDLLDLEEHRGVEVAGYTYPQEITMGSGPEASSVDVRLVSHNFFDLLGARAALGRTFFEDEDRIGAPGTVMLSHEYWIRAMGGAASVLGGTLELIGRRYTIVGVLPRGFTGVTLDPVDLWLPVENAQDDLSFGPWRDNRRSWWIHGVVRLVDGVTLEAAEAEATAILRAAGGDERLQAALQEQDARFEFASLREALDPNRGRVVTWLLGVSWLVLLIACANVANLLTAQAIRRRKEMAVRLALGVSRTRLVVQTTINAVVLALVGGGVGLVLASWGGGILRTILLPDVLFPSPLNARLLGYTLVISVLAGALAGIGAAMQAGRGDIAAVMADSGAGTPGGRGRTRGLLAVAQVALSMVLLVGAGLFGRSLGELRAIDLGLDVERLLVASLELSSEGLGAVETLVLYREAAERAQVVPGVAAATLTTAPFQWSSGGGLRVPGVDSIPRMPGGGPYYWGVDERYFEAVGLRVVAGRGFDTADRAGGQRVATVSVNLADSLWGGAALGQCLIVTIVRSDAEACTTVVGVVEDAARSSFQDAPFFAYYLPIDQIGMAPRGLYVRTRDEPDDVVGAVATALRSFSPVIRFARVTPLQDLLDPQARSWTLGAGMFTVFGLLALAVAALGVYSLLAFNVSERARELGIRSALGAGKGRLLRSVLYEGARFSVLGIVLGLSVVYVAAPYAQELLFEVSARDPGVLAGVAAALIAVGGAASLVPGLRATRVDPVTALKSE